MSYNKIKSKKHQNINFIDNLDELEVNTVKDISNFKDFKYLNMKERLVTLENYLNKIAISQEDKDYLCELVKNNNLKNKNDIDYDKINGCIRSIKLLEFDSELNTYYIKKIINENSYEKQIMKSKRNINKLILS